MDAALALAEQGFAIAESYGVNQDGRCLCTNPGCHAPGKHGGKGWKDNATHDPETIRTRFATGDSSYMVIPQAGSRLLIVDEDVPGALEQLGDLPDTLIVRTSEKPGGGRGRHLYGKLPPGIDESEIPYNWAGGEVRVAGNGGVVGPYCRHTSGATYDPVDDAEVATLPLQWLRALIASGRKRQHDRDTARHPQDPGWCLEVGSRHDGLTSMAGKLRGLGLWGGVLREGLHQLNTERCRPPLPDDEVEGIAYWADAQDHAKDPTRQRSDPVAPRPTPRNVGAALPPVDVDEWLIEGVLRPASILIVASAEGLGKSYIRKEMAARLTTTGGSLFGHYPVTRLCSVLEFDEENGEAEEFRREEQVFTALGVQRAEATEYWSASFTALDLGDQGAQAYIREQVAQHLPGVLMLDTGTSMVGDEWGVELKIALRFLRSLTVEFGCAIVVFVHLVKPPHTGGRRTRAHGTSLGDVMGQWTRPADAVAILRDLGGNQAIWSMFKKVPKSELVVARANGLWSVVRVGTEREPTTDDRVLRAIAAGGKNPDEIAASIGKSSRTISDAIARLRMKGLIAKGYPYQVTNLGHESLE